MKRIALNVRIALHALSNFKLRTSLAMLGVFLGTFSLIVVSNLSGSLSKKTAAEIEGLGRNLLIVRSGVVLRVTSRTSLLSEATNLTLSDAEAVSSGSRFIKEASPSSNRPFPVRYRSTNLNSVLVVGAYPNYQDVRNFYVNEGRFISYKDNRELNRVAVIGKRVAERLFGDESPVGRDILIYRVPCRVIGVMEEKGVDISGIDQDNQIFIPLDTFLRRLVNKEFINSIYVQANDERSLLSAKSDIESILRKRHRISSDKKDDFTVIDMKDVTALKTQAMDTITVLGRISSAVSFLIGGIGILSIMILIVNERRVEIGIRRAVGSRKRDIILQFLMESSLISLSGGVFGMVAGFFASLIILKLSVLPQAVSIKGLILSFIASTAVGILAGIYPSKKATAIQPVDIIRS